jgi:hypothetical protein
MADKIVIKNIKPYDGEYDIDFGDPPLTTLEWRWIKKLAGYLPGTFREGIEGSDPDIVCVLAVIAMRRAGKFDIDEGPRVFQRLAEAPFDGAAINLVAEEIEDADDGPPAVEAAATS